MFKLFFARLVPRSVEQWVQVYAKQHSRVILVIFKSRRPRDKRPGRSGWSPEFTWLGIYPIGKALSTQKAARRRRALGSSKPPPTELSHPAKFISEIPAPPSINSRCSRVECALETR